MGDPLALEDARRLIDREGLPDELDLVYERFFPRLHRYCRRVTAPEHAEDLAQEALVRALENLSRFDTRRPFWPWLKAIARNLAIDHARRRSREVLDVPETPHWDDHTSLHERPLLSAAMSALTSQQRAAVHLRYVEEREAAEAAALMGLSGSAYKQLLYRARRRLRSEYERLVDGVPVLILLPARWLRGRLARIGRSDRVARVHSWGISAESVQQVAAGVLATILVLGANPSAPDASAPAERPDAMVSFDRRAPASQRPEADRQRPPEPRAALPPAQSPSSGQEGRADEAPVDEVVRDKVKDLTDPNAQTEQPEDTRILSIAGDPSGDHVYASGTGRCNETLCHPVLFHSSDRGATWERLAADGLVADQLLLPPSPDDSRIFAMGAEGLLVSEDGGASFHPAAVGGGSQTSGPAAISPAFHAGDPTILMGATPLARYRDDTDTVEPVLTDVPPDRFEPAYSPSYVQDETVFLGASRVDPETGTYASTVYRCVRWACSPAALQGHDTTPTVRPAPDHATSQRVYAFIDRALFVSNDGGRSFQPVNLGWSTDEILRDVAVTPDGLIAATAPTETGGGAGVYLSSDGGTSWTSAESPLLHAGAATVGVVGNRLVAALTDGGVACSSDGGTTWSPRCRD